ncbi:MAG: glycosyltransferase [Prevotella sp.]|nr:glycosyltransferase [Prevotella sp.]
MRVSILVPIYNVERFFARCIESIFSQTYQDIEYVFVNDHTPDGSMSVLGRICEKYPVRANNVKIIENANNQGIAKVRNTLLENAGGDYVLFVDSDDWIEPDMVELMANEAMSRNADVVGCDYYEDYESRSVVVRQEYPSGHDEAMKAMTLLKIKGVLWKLLIRRDILMQNDLRFIPTIHFAEDYIFCCKLFYYSHVFASVNKPLYHYIQYNPNNYSSTAIDKRVESFARAIREVERFYRQEGVYEKLEKELTVRKFLIKSQYVLDNGHVNIRKWSRLFPESNHVWREMSYSRGNRMRFFLANCAANVLQLLNSN